MRDDSKVLTDLMRFNACDQMARVQVSQDTADKAASSSNKSLGSELTSRSEPLKRSNL